MTDRDLLKQALEALDSCDINDRDIGDQYYDAKLVDVAITALRERLAQPEQTVTSNHSNSHQPEQSPLDRMAKNARELGLDYEPTGIAVRKVWWDGDTLRAEAIPPEQVYKQPEQEPVAWTGVDFAIDCTPPRREWVGLTDEEVIAASAAATYMDDLDAWEFARAIEAKLKEKNA